MLADKRLTAEAAPAKEKQGVAEALAGKPHLQDGLSNTSRCVTPMVFGSCRSQNKATKSRGLDSVALERKDLS